MPREVVHVHCAAEQLEHALDRFLLDQPYRSLFLLAALAPDAPYYYRGGFSEFKKVGNSLHGANGEDTLSFSRTLYASSSKAVKAFALGFATHCIVDWHFHPLVFYKTGNFDHPDPAERKKAVRAHWLYEVYLDLYCLAAFRKKEVVLGDLYRSAKVLIPEVCAELEAAGFGSARQWAGALSHLVSLQKVFISSCWGRGVNVLASAGLSFFQHHQALFEAGKVVPDQLFSGVLSYRMPHSGEPRLTSLLNLYALAGNEIASLLRNPTHFLANTIGNSLASGEVGSRSADLRFFEPVAL